MIGEFEKTIMRFPVKKGFFYMMISIIATVMDFGLLLVLVEYINLYYLLASIISFVAGVLTKFWLNRMITFRDREQKWTHQLSKFIVVSTSGLLITTCIMFIGVDLLQIPYQISKVLCIGIVFFFTLTFHNYFSFSTRF